MRAVGNSGHAAATTPTLRGAGCPFCGFHYSDVAVGAHQSRRGSVAHTVNNKPLFLHFKLLQPAKCISWQLLDGKSTQPHGAVPGTLQAHPAEVDLIANPKHLELLQAHQCKLAERVGVQAGHWQLGALVMLQLLPSPPGLGRGHVVLSVSSMIQMWWLGRSKRGSMGHTSSVGTANRFFLAFRAACRQVCIVQYVHTTTPTLSPTRAPATAHRL